MENGKSPPPLGLKDVYACRDRTPEIDIIAVHGIGAHRDFTWKRSGGIDWLENPSMLSADLPHSRIMTFGYESLWFGKDRVATRLDAISGQLRDLLQDVRRSCPGRPIIFIGHCFGGIVIERLLVDAQQVRDAGQASLLDNLAGVVLLGTPHRGSDSHELIVTVAKIASLFNMGSQSLILKTLRPDSEILDDTIRKFAILAVQKRFKIHCFHEAHETDLSALIRRQGLPAPRTMERIVPKSSACLDGFPETALQLDHFHLNTFTGPDDANYHLVRNALKNMLQGIGMVEDKKGPNTRFLVGYQRNGKFQGRDSELRKIEALLTGVYNNQQRAVLYGMGGIGKTQIAREWAYRSRKTHSIFWAEGGSREQLERSFLEIGLKVGVVPESMETKDYVPLVKEWLDADISGSWRLIIDNVDNKALESDFGSILPIDRGSILFIGRNLDDFESLVYPGQELLVNFMSEEDAKAMFLDQSGVSKTDKVIQKVEELVVKLDYIPLAITQAAVYIKRARMPVDEYAKMISRSNRRSRDIQSADLLRKGVREPHSEISHAIMLTWDCSYSRLLEYHPCAARLMQVLSLLSPEDIPTLLLDPEILHEVCSSPTTDFDLREALATILSFAMMSIPGNEISLQDGTVKVAGLVSLWIRRTKIPDELHLADVALKLVAQQFPLVDSRTRYSGSYLVSHVRAVQRYCESIKAPDSDIARQLRYRLGRHLYYTGAFAEAETVLLLCFNDLERVGADDQQLGDCGRYLALTRSILERDDAEEWIDRVYLIREKALGKINIATLQSLCDKALFLSGTKSDKQAKEMIIEIIDKHSDTLRKGDELIFVQILARLSEICQRLSQLQEAYDHCSLALEIAESRYGIRNTVTLTLTFIQIEVLGYLKGPNAATDKLNDFVDKFADKVESIGDDGSASLYMSDKLELVLPALRMFWTGSPRDEVDFMDYIAASKMQEGRLYSGVKWYEIAYLKAEEAVGKDSILSLFVQAHLATALAEVGRLNDAMFHIDHILQVNKGSNILEVKQKKARIHRKKGEVLEAQALLLSMYKEDATLEGNANSVRTTVSLANLDKVMGNYQQATKRYLKALKGFQNLNSDHAEEEADAYEGLGTVLIYSGQHDDAIIQLNRALAGCPNNQIMQAHIKLDICIALSQSGKEEKAFEQCQAIISDLEMRDKFKENDQLKVKALITRSACYQNRAEYEKALEEFQEARKLRARLLNNNENHPELLEIDVALGQIYMKMAKKASASQRQDFYASAQKEFSMAYWRCTEHFGIENNHTERTSKLLVDAMEKISQVPEPEPPQRGKSIFTWRFR